MRETHEYEGSCADLNSVRDKLFGAALVAFAVVAFGAYSFATAEAPQSKPAQMQTVSTIEVRTTPDDRGQREMPPPVAPSKAN
jgi:hypothetical protein